MSKLKDWLYAGGILLAVGFWFFTLYGLPPRVEILEKKVSAHEERLARSDVKLDMIADDVKSIKVILLNAAKN
ncbi:hypothetical protein [Candidatus Avelusimicrobium stercoris]|uniref:hypothetical protein n=1 Tax=Candidatus Avelusimicrobium stercoris TaxID=1947924 RepID=UPI000EE880BA|nr:hypothetical protein [Elusimicrobiota bacterium]